MAEPLTPPASTTAAAEGVVDVVAGVKRKLEEVGAAGAAGEESTEVKRAKVE